MLLKRCAESFLCCLRGLAQGFEPLPIELCHLSRCPLLHSDTRLGGVLCQGNLLQAVLLLTRKAGHADLVCRLCFGAGVLVHLRPRKRRFISEVFVRLAPSLRHLLLDDVRVLLEFCAQCRCVNAEVGCLLDLCLHLFHFLMERIHALFVGRADLIHNVMRKRCDALLYFFREAFNLLRETLCLTRGGVDAGTACTPAGRCALRLFAPRCAAARLRGLDLCTLRHDDVPIQSAADCLSTAKSVHIHVHAPTAAGLLNGDPNPIHDSASDVCCRLDNSKLFHGCNRLIHNGNEVAHIARRRRHRVIDKVRSGLKCSGKRINNRADDCVDLRHKPCDELNDRRAEV